MKSNYYMRTLRAKARAYLRHISHPQYEHDHRGLLRWSGEIEMCGCGAFRQVRGRRHARDARWIEPGATQYTLEQARAGSRLAQRSIGEEFQYAR
jgi:hypothetical protein